MAKQNVIVPETMTKTIAKTATSASSSPPVMSYPPPRGVTPTYAINRKFLKKLEIGSAAGSAGVGVGGGRINTWNDSLKASSPTHAKAEENKTWMVNHPSALVMFEEILKASKGKKIAMFLDYDGTLSPIVNDPDQAFMSESMRSVVRNVARYFPTAIISGRCRDKVYDFVGLAELYYAGSHGMDIKGPARHTNDSRGLLFQPASEFVPMIDEVYKSLVEKTRSVPGARVENNKFCLSVHFRCVDEKSWAGLAEEVRSVISEYPKLKLTQGRKVLEIRPSIKWDKGKALEFLLESLGQDLHHSRGTPHTNTRVVFSILMIPTSGVCAGFADCNDVLPVYIGDDRTDEDAFKVLRDRGQGLGILVSKIPKETNASYSLREPSEVMAFLHRLVEWKLLTQRTVKGG